MHQATVRIVTWVVGTSFLLAGCGASPTMARAHAASRLAAQGVPPSSAFVTVTGKVTQVLPDTHNPHNNLDHQNFVVQTTDGQSLTCNNDDSPGIGTKVPGLAVGQSLTIRGVEYHDPGQDGIHWTHHNVKPGDAGWIKTADGTVYQ